MVKDTSAPDGSDADRFNIDALVDDLMPVRQIRLREGMVIALAMMAVCALAIGLRLGVRGDLANGVPHWMFLLRSAALLALGTAAAVAALSASTPLVGSERPGGWRWALAVAAVFPLGAGFVWLADIRSVDQARRLLDPQYGQQCLQMSMLCAVAIGLAMTAWLRRGAPVSPERTGWLVGLAAGALGAAAYSISCSENAVVYIGTWYTVAIGGCAIGGRVVVTPLLRW
ncbi:DUF1109 domain-containing protein [Blastomonas sp.]|uniref:DUF1109 domain-containing protein n=1 Tax=Blastomonas sp. TaxID=1909299 RepID=UPI002634494F|nr:DUF1109 domain-containing protein [Blastomonas sp.]MDM7957248.1 DUF1109 domain-containing protein [Blastomonas sp.]